MAAGSTESAMSFGSTTSKERELRRARLPVVRSWVTRALAVISSTWYIKYLFQDSLEMTGDVQSSNAEKHAIRMEGR